MSGGGSDRLDFQGGDGGMGRIGRSRGASWAGVVIWFRWLERERKYSQLPVNLTMTTVDRAEHSHIQQRAKREVFVT